MNFREGKIEGVIIKKLDKYVDNRGYLIETFRIDQLAEGLRPQMSYVSYTRPGIARGPHEHREQTDIFCFIGPGSFKIKLWDNREGSPTYGNFMEIVGGRENQNNQDKQDKQSNQNRQNNQNKQNSQNNQDNLISVIVPPGVVHGYKNISNEDGMVLNFPDRLYRGWGKREEVDEIRHEDAQDEFYLDFI